VINIVPSKPNCFCCRRSPVRILLISKATTANCDNWLGSGVHHLPVSVDAATESTIALVGSLKLLIPIARLIDKTAELARLDKEIQRIQNDLPRVEGKLSNPAFVDKAPAEVIEKEKTKLADMHLALTNLQAQRQKISTL
jgi:valyl-tRNA synthetase